MPVEAETPEGFPVERFPVVRVRYPDEQPGPFLEGFSVKVHGSVFGHDPVGVCTGCDDAGSRIEVRHYLVLALVGA